MHSSPEHESSRIFRTEVRYASSALTSGIAKGSQPFAWDVGLCPTSLSPRFSCCDARKNGFCGSNSLDRDVPRTPAGTLRSLHPRFFEFLKQKFGMTHGRVPTRSVQQPYTHSHEEIRGRFVALKKLLSKPEGTVKV